MARLSKAEQDNMVVDLTVSMDGDYDEEAFEAT